MGVKKQQLVLPSTCFEGDKNKPAMRHNSSCPTVQKSNKPITMVAALFQTVGRRLLTNISSPLAPISLCNQGGLMLFRLTGSVATGVSIACTFN